jgi:hypothetical protein
VREDAVLEVIIRTLVAQFPEAKTAPSVVLSWLEDRKVFYGSLITFNKPFGGDKQVLFKCSGTTVEEVYQKMCEQLAIPYKNENECVCKQPVWSADGRCDTCGKLLGASNG